MPIDRYQVANEAYNYYGDPPSSPSNSNIWWENLRKWIEDYIKPLVPVAELGYYVGKIIEQYRLMTRR